MSEKDMNPKVSEMLARSEANAKNSGKKFIRPEDEEREVIAPDGSIIKVNPIYDYFSGARHRRRNTKRYSGEVS